MEAPATVDLKDTCFPEINLLQTTDSTSPAHSYHCFTTFYPLTNCHTGHSPNNASQLATPDTKVTFDRVMLNEPQQQHDEISEGCWPAHTAKRGRENKHKEWDGRAVNIHKLEARRKSNSHITRQDNNSRMHANANYSTEYSYATAYGILVENIARQ